MKNFLKNHRTDMNVFAVFLYIFFMLFSYDPFCFDSVTTETPLLKIGELPLLRSDFVALLFALTALIGAAIGTVLRFKNKGYSSIISTLLGVFMLFFVFFDVDMLQILAPSMRISHVTMTLSRLSAIAAGASGIVAGLALPLLSAEKHAKALISGVLAATLLSILAVQEKLYTMTFCAVSVILLVIGICGQFFNNDKCAENVKPVALSAVAEAIDRFTSLFAVTVLCLTLSGYLTKTEGYGPSAYFICVLLILGGYALAKGTRFKTAAVPSAAALILCCLSIAFRPFALIVITCAVAGFAAGSSRYNDCETTPWDSLVSVAAIFIGAIVSYYVIHDLSEVMTFSSNRIVYLVQSNLFIPTAIVLGVKLIYNIIDLLTNKKGGIYDNLDAVR